MAFYWYERDPELYKAEVTAMRKFFPSFKINQLQDGSGRLYWRGKVRPTGPNGMEWELMLIYKNNHPYTAEGEYGGSIQILPISPRLKDIASSLPIRPEKGLGLGLPHIYRVILEEMKNILFVQLIQSILKLDKMYQLLLLQH